MCLILFSLNQHPKYRLVLAANRDEFFNRKTLFANSWAEHNDIFGGRDVKSMGTWLGFNTNGRFIAITNYRDPSRENSEAKSRGNLSKVFLTGNSSVEDFTSEISKYKTEFNGFNLLMSTDGMKSMVHYSNISDKMTHFDSGRFGLSNALLDTPWPKVTFGKDNLKTVTSNDQLDTNDLIKMLGNPDEAADNQLPDTGISFDLEKKLSPVFISMNGYGTRCSTAMLVDQNNMVKFHEVSYNENRAIINDAVFEVQLKY